MPPLAIQPFSTQWPSSGNTSISDGTPLRRRIVKELQTLIDGHAVVELVRDHERRSSSVASDASGGLPTSVRIAAE